MPSCRFLTVGCTATQLMSGDELERHYASQVSAHLALTADSLLKSRSDNKMLQRALTSAQTRCRQSEAGKQKQQVVYESKLEALTLSLDSLKQSVGTILMELGKRDREIKQLRAQQQTLSAQQQPGERVVSSDDDEKDEQGEQVLLRGVQERKSPRKSPRALARERRVLTGKVKKTIPAASAAASADASAAAAPAWYQYFLGGIQSAWQQQQPAAARAEPAVPAAAEWMPVCFRRHVADFGFTRMRWANAKLAAFEMTPFVVHPRRALTWSSHKSGLNPFARGLQSMAAGWSLSVDPKMALALRTIRDVNEAAAELGETPEQLLNLDVGATALQRLETHRLKSDLLTQGDIFVKTSAVRDSWEWRKPLERRIVATIQELCARADTLEHLKQEAFDAMANAERRKLDKPRSLLQKSGLSLLSL
jgi:hypothetical protein